ncbi:MAG: GGDEF domain-containing protein [gamma proteobacterium symbiont of Ctena orbiculata]|nr:MAG: GGDEF domain-containing protein [gamma proteobacterium symbiont of Ctena orbiculata]PVV18857.1 MAG: GGDEF domain-containing protein [gamma proteobacterium symbiont of Ctena orbiculata]
MRSLNILDTPPEERFDRLTRMAKKLFRVPISLVSLVDEERQWFKSCAGLSVSETPRDISFCGHAILGNDLFIIPDALEDERFRDNPLVVNEPKRRFYAGCPIRALDGQKLGTLCIIDQKPRDFDRDDLEALVDLASMVEQELAAMQMETMDELTQILNRRGFMMLAQHSLNLYTREELIASLVFMDLDNFKPINDRFGYAEGDRALNFFAQQLKSAFRDSDVVARLGEDEFVVLIANSINAGAEDLVARFRQKIINTNRRSGFGYEISFSHGIVEFNPERPCTIETLLVEGDSIMYQSKQRKRQYT